jgi:hypothetical protein
MTAKLMIDWFPEISLFRVIVYPSPILRGKEVTKPLFSYWNNERVLKNVIRYYFGKPGVDAVVRAGRAGPLSEEEPHAVDIDIYKAKQFMESYRDKVNASINKALQDWERAGAMGVWWGKQPDDAAVILAHNPKAKVWIVTIRPWHGPAPKKPYRAIFQKYDGLKKVLNKSFFYVGVRNLLKGQGATIMRTRREKAAKFLNNYALYMMGEIEAYLDKIEPELDDLESEGEEWKS